MTAEPPATLRLLAALRLASPALPIGGFSYSQGLETAIERGWIQTESQVREWLHDLLACVIGRFEAPLVLALCEAVAHGDVMRTDRLHALFIASRESAELHAETVQMGFSLERMMHALPEGGRLGPVEAPGSPAEVALPLAWARAAHAFGLPPTDALAAYLWAWLENQVMAAIKAVPLGQQAGQRLLSALVPVLARTCADAATLAEDDWSNFAPGLALASSWHETQYTRIFRS